VTWRFLDEVEQFIRMYVFDEEMFDEGMSAEFPSIVINNG
jgi:hypothetical protein